MIDIDLRLENASMEINLSSKDMSNIASSYAGILTKNDFLGAAAYVTIKTQDGITVELQSRVTAPDGQIFAREENVTEKKIMIDPLPEHVFAGMQQTGGIQAGFYTYEVYANEILVGRKIYSVFEAEKTKAVTLTGARMYSDLNCVDVMAQLTGGEDVYVDDIVFGKGRVRGYLFHVYWNGIAGYMQCGDLMIKPMEE